MKFFGKGLIEDKNMRFESSLICSRKQIDETDIKELYFFIFAQRASVYLVGIYMYVLVFFLTTIRNIFDGLIFMHQVLYVDDIHI